VARRVRDFGTLKALGWRSRRIIAQVMGESLVIGILGGAAGIALGFAGAAIITAVAPELSASIPNSTSASVVSVGVPAGRDFPQAAAQTVAVPMSASVTVAAIVAAVLLAVAGGLLAGSFASWRIARLRPADALARVA
jgi:ABC-type antimicrobial peptide transport system permease subunit